jgi:hypothetical protein
LGGSLNPFDSTVTSNSISNLAASMDLFPNPTNSHLNLKISFEKEVANITYILSNINGQVLEIVARNNLQQDIYSFDVKNLPAGVYFITVRTAEGIRTERFLKQ